MKPYLVLAGMVCAMITPAGLVRGAAPTLHERTLPNGIRVAYLHAAGSADFSTFTFSPMGLAHDDAGRAQWAHLIEHLVLRTTMPGALANANAETLPDHMRLDVYGNKDTWRDGLTHQAKWLGGLPFTERSIREEPGRANGETAFAIKAFATHKFATAAWNQVVRHGREHAGVKADLLNIDRAVLEAYRDEHLVVPGRTLVCMTGGVEPAEALAAAEAAFGPIKPAGKPAKAVALPKPGDRGATWDLDARHVLITWPIPGPAAKGTDYAALFALSRLVWMRVTQDVELKNLIGQPIVGTDLHCSESSYFYVSAGCRDGADTADVGKRLAEHVAQAGKLADPSAPIGQLCAMLAAELEPMDPAVIAGHAPKDIKPGMIEAQVALTWASGEYRLLGQRGRMIKALKSLTAAQVREAVGKHLNKNRSTTLTLTPTP